MTLVTGDRGENPELEALGVEIVPIGGLHILDGNRGLAAARGIYSQRTKRILADWIACHDTPATIYHLHNWHKVLSPSAFAALSAVDDRLCLSAHDYFLACPNGSFMHFPRARPCSLVPMSRSCLCTACDKRNYAHKLWRVARHVVRQRLFEARRSRATVLAVHAGMIAHLARGGIPAENIKVLPNPVMPWSAARIEAERNHDVFYVGRVELDKGIDILARAARKAGAKLNVIGDGPLRAALARDHPEVTFLGRLQRPELATAIAGARLVVVPSRTRETFGLTAVEALTSGIPVIVSRLVPIAEDIEARGYGLAFDPNDEWELARLIRLAMQDNDRIRTMSVTGFRSASSLALEPKSWCAALIDLYTTKLRDVPASRVDYTPTQFAVVP